ncbi:MAG: LPS translocon maturation chaperone LptM [Sulfuricaulis sp.]
MDLPENHPLLGRLRPALLLVGACAVVLLLGCGKKGPLYLPDETRAQTPVGDHVVRPALPQPDL